MAGIGYGSQVFEEAFALIFGEGSKDFGLKIDRDLSNGRIGFVAVGKHNDPMGAAVAFVGLAFHQAARFHPFQERRNGVRVGTDYFSKLALADAFRIAFHESPKNGELIRSKPGVNDSAAEGLVEREPGSPQERRKSTPDRSIDRK